MGAYDQMDKRPRRRRKQRKPLSWDMVRADIIGIFVHSMVGDGTAVLLGTSADGSLLSVNVYDDGEREKYYIRAADGILEELGDILEDYGRMDSIAFVGLCSADRSDENGKNGQSNAKGKNGA